jgi:hypothetical protein
VRFALVHSPVVGPTTWKWVADRLRGDGHEVVVPDLVLAATEGNPAGFAAAAARAVDGETETVVVGHSGAGAVLPLIAAAMTVPPGALVFVDAGLPPAAGEFVAGGSFRERLRALARDGLLPPWSEWWEPGTFAALVPDRSRRDLIEHELPRVPLSFYETPIEVPRGWSDAKGCSARRTAPTPTGPRSSAGRSWPTWAVISTSSTTR